VLVYLLAWLGILGATPAAPVLPDALPLDGRAVTAVVAVALTFALSWLLWTGLVRRLAWAARPDSETAGLPMLVVLLVVGAIAWLGNPLTALLVVPALHLWLALAVPERLELGRPARRAAALALVVLGVLPLLALIAFYAHQLGLGAPEVAWMALLLLGGGHVGLAAAVVWSLALGCAAAAAIMAVGSRAVHAPPRVADGVEVTIRGPMSYAGPGSLGGTESALRR
jgi:hypothetical protein